MAQANREGMRTRVKPLAAAAIFLGCLSLTPAEPAWIASSSGAFELLALLVREGRYRPRTLGWIRQRQGHPLDFGVLSNERRGYLVMDWARLHVPPLSVNTSAYELIVAGVTSQGVSALKLSICGGEVEQVISHERSFLTRLNLGTQCFGQRTVLSIEATGSGEIQNLDGTPRLVYAMLDRLEIVPLEIRPATQKYAYLDAFATEIQKTAGLITSLLDQGRRDAAQDFLQPLIAAAPDHPAVIKLQIRFRARGGTKPPAAHASSSTE